MLAFLGHQPQDTQKSALRRMYEKILTRHKGGEPVTKALLKTAPARTAVESLGTGAVLGLVHANAKHGLDMQVKAEDASGKGGIRMPADAAVGVVGLFAGAPNIAASGFSVFSFRKTLDLLATKRAKEGKPAPIGKVGVAATTGPAAHGEGDEDPILKAARAHGY